MSTTATTLPGRKPTTRTNKPTASDHPTDINDLAGVFRLLAEPIRLQALRALATAPDGRLNVGEICAAVGAGQPAVSHHLAIMRIGGVVSCRREGKRVYYRLEYDRLIGAMDALLERS